MPPDNEDPVLLAAWTIGALGVGAWSESKSSVDELRRHVEAHTRLPKQVCDGLIADLDGAHEQMRDHCDRLPACFRSRIIAEAAWQDLKENLCACPLLRDSVKSKLLSELRPLRQDTPELLLGEILLMRRMAEVVLVLDCFEAGLDLRTLKSAVADPLAKSSRLSELLLTLLL